MPRTSPSATWVRAAGTVILVGGLVVFLISVLRSIRAPRLPDESFLDATGPLLLLAVRDLLPLVGISALLNGLASLIERPVETGAAAASFDPGESPALAAPLEQIRTAVELIPGALERLTAQTRAEHAHAGRNDQPGQPPPAAASHAAAASGPDVVAAIERMTAVLQEIRELSLLDDAGRQSRLQAMRRRTHVAAVAEVEACIRQGEWGRADALLSQAVLDDPRDPDVQRLRAEVERGRAAAEGEAVNRIRGRVEDLMAIADWDQAMRVTTEFAENYPSNAQGQALLARVTRERNLFRESTVQKLFEEVKADVERRQWRRALAGAHRLLEKFPDHRRAERVRSQLPTIQGNAEIEERQEAEARIQQLIKSHRYAEAVELAERLLERFPLSPQAESLEELLPKLRSRAMNAEAHAEGR